MVHPAALVAAGGFVWAVKNIAEKRKRNPRGLPTPPGPRGLPVLGNLFQLPQAEQWKVYSEWSREYGKHRPIQKYHAKAANDLPPAPGDMVYVDVMGQPILVLGSLELTEDLMEKHATMYSDRPTLPIGQLYVALSCIFTKSQH